MKAILKIGVRELDLVCEYTGHPYNPVLGVLTGTAVPAAKRSSALRACFNGTSLTTQERGCMMLPIAGSWRRTCLGSTLLLLFARYTFRVFLN